MKGNYVGRMSSEQMETLIRSIGVQVNWETCVYEENVKLFNTNCQ